jgi:hypothetical protein
MYIQESKFIMNLKCKDENYRALIQNKIIWLQFYSCAYSCTFIYLCICINIYNTVKIYTDYVLIQTYIPFFYYRKEKFLENKFREKWHGCGFIITYRQYTEIKVDSIYRYLYIHVCMYIHVPIYIHLNTYKYICMYIYIYNDTHILHIHIHINVYVIYLNVHIQTKLRNHIPKVKGEENESRRGSYFAPPLSPTAPKGIYIYIYIYICI